MCDICAYFCQSSTYCYRDNKVCVKNKKKLRVIFMFVGCRFFKKFNATFRELYKVQQKQHTTFIILINELFNEI